MSKENCLSRLKELTAIVESLPSDSESLALLPHINAQLDNITTKIKVVVAATATTSAQATTTSRFTQKDAIPPNKKNETQPRFKPTTKKPGRHATGKTLR